MNKAELINAVATAAEVSKKDAEAVITATLDTPAGRPHRPQPQDQRYDRDPRVRRAHL